MGLHAAPWPWLLLTLSSVAALGRQQRFRVRPSNISVIEGDSAILRCEVDHQAGQLQWAKEGFAMGYSRPMPGYPRYRLLGDPGSGVHDLEITNVTLDDDGRFQCQVSPNRGQTAIRAAAYLTVLLKPTSVNLRSRGWLVVRPQVVQVRQGQHVTLECDVIGSKPAASVRWQRNGVDIVPEFRLEAVRPSAAPRRNDTRASMTLQPTAADDGARISCVALHPAVLASERHLYNATLTLSVQHPPGSPAITGYTDGEVVVKGERVTLTCTSEGGNPPGIVSWFKNDRRIMHASRNETRAAVAQHSFVADESDLNAIYRCEVSSKVYPTPMVALVRMNVHFGPERVRVWGTEEAMDGDPVHMSCTTSSSNPPANVTWTINGRTMNEVSQVINLSPAGGWITASNLSTVVPPATRRDMKFACYAKNAAVDAIEVGSASVSVLYAPEPPRISRTEPTTLRQGERLSLLCAAAGGNPPARLAWTVAGRPRPGLDAGAGRSRLQYDVSAADNGAVVTCRSSSPAAELQLEDSVTLTVHFPPSQLEISVSPDRLEAGGEALLICQSRPSLPAAQLTWWTRGQEVKDQVQNTETFPAGDNGGYASRLVLRRSLNWTDNGAEFVCKAEVAQISSFIRHEVTLRVLHAPIFMKKYFEDSMILGESRAINLSALANPAVLSYTWSRDDVPLTSGDVRVTSAAGVMNLTSVRREDAGWYRLEAVNTLGSATARVHVDVLYPPEAVKATSALVSPGDDAFLECVAEANPATPDAVHWERPGFDLVRRSRPRTQAAAARLTSRLAVYDVTAADVGEFTCVVDNGVGAPVRVTAALLVEHAPELDKSAARGRAAAEAGGTAFITCRARAAPNASFTWSRSGRPLQPLADGPYRIALRRIDLMTWASVLEISNVQASDYGPYNCTATNRLGSDSQTVQLVLPSVPDPPLDLRVLNVSSQTVTLAWTPGFDGGFTQTFRVGYAPVPRPTQYRYVDAAPDTAAFTVDQLSALTEYRFSVAAYNRLGVGDFSPRRVTARTTELTPPVGFVTDRDSPEDDGLRRPLILAAAAVGSALLLLNGLLALCYVRRRHHRKGPDGPGSKVDAVPHCGHESSSSLDVHGGHDSTRDVCDVPDIDRNAWLEVVRISPPPEYGGSTLRLARQVATSPQHPPNYADFPPAGELELSREARSSATPDLINSSDSSRLSGPPARLNGSTPYLAGGGEAAARPERAYCTLPHKSKLRIPSSLISLGSAVPPPLACDLSYEHRGHLV